MSIGALVSGGAAREPNRENFSIKIETCLFSYLFKQFMLRDEMRGPDVFGRQAQRAAQAVVVFPPRWNVAVKKLLGTREKSTCRREPRW